MNIVKPLIRAAVLLGASSLAQAQQPSIYIDFGDPAAGFGVPDTSHVSVAPSPGLWNGLAWTIHEPVR